MNEGIKKFGKRLLFNAICVLILQLLFLFLGFSGVTASNFVAGWLLGVVIWTVLDYLANIISVFHKRKN